MSAALGATALASPALAQAPATAKAAITPLTALKKQFVTGRGVKFSDITTFESDGDKAILTRRKGLFRFGRAGVAASDITNKFNLKASDIEDLEGLEGVSKDFFTPERTVKIGRTAYIKGGFFSSLLPADKTWVRIPDGPVGGTTGVFGQPISIAEPNTLKTLLAHSVKKGSTYAGTITFGQLYKVSPWFQDSQAKRPAGNTAKRKIAWKLYVNRSQLPVRLISYSFQSGDKQTVDTRYSGWGGRVTIAAPPADQVADVTDLDFGDGAGLAMATLSGLALGKTA